MENKKIFKVLGAIFALRARYYDERGEHWAASAYINAFDMLAYATQENGKGWENLRQFGWSDEAEELIDKLGADIDFWDLEDFIRKGLDKPTEV